MSSTRRQVHARRRPGGVGHGGTKNRIECAQPRVQWQRQNTMPGRVGRSTLTGNVKASSYRHGSTGDLMATQMHKMHAFMDCREHREQSLPESHCATGSAAPWSCSSDLATSMVEWCSAPSLLVGVGVISRHRVHGGWAVSGPARLYLPRVTH